MPKEEIVEGLKQAVGKGEPLNKAMMTFYNAGYSKEEIEEAARVMNAPSPLEMQPIQTSQPKNQIQTTKEFQVPQPQYQPAQQTPGQSFIQKVSSYESGERPKPISAVLIFVLVFFLLFLLGALVAVFLFKDELTSLFNSAL